jgi:hypothetical protein
MSVAVSSAKMPNKRDQQQKGVMAGLVPAIHVFTACLVEKNVDARHKAGHDEAERS